MKTTAYYFFYSNPYSRSILEDYAAVKKIRTYTFINLSKSSDIESSFCLSLATGPISLVRLTKRLLVEIRDLVKTGVSVKAIVPCTNNFYCGALIAAFKNEPNCEIAIVAEGTKITQNGLASLGTDFVYSSKWAFLNSSVYHFGQNFRIT